MDSLVNAINDFVRAKGVSGTYWIAYSGGLDSHVLLHLFAKLRVVYPLKLRAVYINHGINPDAANWAMHCASVCQALNIDLVQRSLGKIDTSSSPEDTLRQFRYQILSELMLPGDVLLTAHHQNDQAETILLQLLRGAGPKGLAAMPKIKSFAAGWHARPLLDFTRADLECYAKKQELQWVEDASNQSTHYTRNFLRHQILPILTERWPTVTRTLARSALHCAEAQQMIERLTEQNVEELRGHFPQTLSIKKLLQLDQNNQSHVLRAWILQANYPLPSFVKMQNILRDLLLARNDKMPHVSWRGVELRRYRDDLFLSPCLTLHDATQIMQWDLNEPLAIPLLGELSARPCKGMGMRADIKKVTVRFRQGGEMFQLPGRRHRHELKKLFQMWGIPPWQRDRVPLLEVDGRIAAVVGWAVADEFLAREGEEGIACTLIPDPSPNCVGRRES